MLFKDFLTWYRETVRFGANHDSVNWLIKPHPNRDSFDMEHDAVTEAQSIVGNASESSVTALSSDTTHADLVGLVDTVITLDGTGGLEYACYGTPTVLASKSPYSGFGFTHEPQTRKEYFETLRAIGDLPRLTAEQVEQAKVVCYLYFDLIRNIPEFSSQGPNYPQKGATEWERASEFRSRLEADDLSAKIQEFVAQDRVHYIDPERLNEE